MRARYYHEPNIFASFGAVTPYLVFAYTTLDPQVYVKNFYHIFEKIVSNCGMFSPSVGSPRHRHDGLLTVRVVILEPIRVKDKVMAATPGDSNTRPPRLSLIVPSRDGYRDGAVPRLMESIERQSFRDYETILIKEIAPQGKAINRGADQARGEVFVILDDDSELADEHVLERLIRALDSDESIGMAGANIVVHPNATHFQRRAAKQFPRFNMPVADAIIDSDFPCHGCCAIPRSVFEEVGREREDILRGLDPDLRVRIRAAGYRVVLAPNARVYHPLPDGWRPLLRIFFRNGYGSAYTQRVRPDTVFETDERLSSSGFRPTRPFWYRAGRLPLRILGALMGGRLIRSGAYTAYALGYAWGWLTVPNRRATTEPS